MFTLWIVWLVLTAFVASLALFRKFAARKEDDLVHLSGGEQIISQQFAVAEKLDKIDYWGKLLTVVVFASGIILGAITLYITWQNSLALEK